MDRMNQLESRGSKTRVQNPKTLTGRVRGLLTNFNRLSWRLGLAISGVVVATVISSGIFLSVQVGLILDRFVRSLDPNLGAEISHRFDVFTNDDNNTAGFGNYYYVFLFGLLAFGVIVALVVARRIGRPLEQIARTATAVARGDLSARVPLTERQRRSGDEVTQLAVNFNAMTESLAHLEAERRATNAAIAHELRTPLMVLQARLEAVRDGVIPMGETEAEQLLSQVSTLTRLVDDLRTLSLADAGKLDLKLEPIDLLDVVTLSVAVFGARAETRGVNLELNAKDLAVPVRGDRDRLAQVMANLLENALRHTPDGGRIEISLWVQTSETRITVRDTGPGFPPEAMPHLFERFYRADTSRRRASGGSGLGLAVVKTILELHGGAIQATNAPGGGAQLDLRLPILKF
jgi:two-component system, OmpR family, sensor histidine kinase BaeS